MIISVFQIYLFFKLTKMVFLFIKQGIYVI